MLSATLPFADAAEARGYVSCPGLGGELDAESFIHSYSYLIEEPVAK